MEVFSLRKIDRIAERTYRVSEVAEMLSVTRHTVSKWLSVNDPEYAVIPRSSWFRLPSGHIRIKESGILMLMGELDDFEEPK